LIPQARDEEICMFLKKTKLATTSQIERVFFSKCKYSGNVTRRRMLKLFDAGLVKRFQADFSSQYIYWIDGKKPVQKDHRLLITEIYVRVLTLGKGTLDTWECEPHWGEKPDLIPDAFCKYIIPAGDKRRQCNRCFEVERWTGNQFNQQKYEDYYSLGTWKEQLNIASFPKIVIVTDKKIKIEDTDNHINYVVINTKLDKLESVF
jgi:hypothetical protein